MAELTVVTTAQQLVDAVEEGALHIEIRDHLDLTTVRPRDVTDTMRMLNEDVNDTSDFGQSIRVCVTGGPAFVTALFTEVVGIASINGSTTLWQSQHRACTPLKARSTTNRGLSWPVWLHLLSRQKHMLLCVVLLVDFKATQSCNNRK